MKPLLLSLEGCYVYIIHFVYVKFKFVMGKSTWNLYFSHVLHMRIMAVVVVNVW